MKKQKLHNSYCLETSSGRDEPTMEEDAVRNRKVPRSFRDDPLNDGEDGFMRCVNIADYMRTLDGKRKRRKRQMTRRWFQLDSRLFNEKEQQRFDYLCNLCKRMDAPTDLREQSEKAKRSYLTFSRHASLFLEIERNSKTCSTAREYHNVLRNIAGVMHRELNCHMHGMVKMLRDEFDRYRSIHSSFFSFVIRRNVKLSTTNVLRDALTHIVNFSPSIALAQLTRFVFKNEYIDDVCEFLTVICGDDDLFIARTNFILNRYSSLGHRVAQSILDQLCQEDHFMFPLTARRRCDISNDDAISNIKDVLTNEPLLTKRGECKKFDEFFKRIFYRPEIARTICEFLHARKEEPLIAMITNERRDVGAIFALANVLHWRYDGVSVVDSSRCISVDLTKMDRRRFSTSFTSQLILAANITIVTSSSASDISDDNRAEERTKGRNNFRGSGNTLEKVVSTLLLEKMRRVMSTFDTRSKNRTSGTSIDASDAIDDTPNENLENDDDDVCDGVTNDDGVFIDGSKSARFVRYRDKSSGERLMLNLYMNRFEPITPAVTSLLTINYDDFDPPRTYRFNECRDGDIYEFVCSAICEARSYFDNICSRDAINHYLYSRVTAIRDPFVVSPEEKKKNDKEENKTSLRVEDTKVDGYFFNLSGSDLVTAIRACDEDSNIRHRRMCCEVYDLLNRLNRSLSLRDAIYVLTSHEIAKRFTLTCVNLANVFGERELFEDDGAPMTSW